MQSEPAVPPYEPTLTLTLNDSSRRILWIIGLYRAVCAAVLLGIALLLDLRMLNIAAPNAFVTASGLYFLFGLFTFWWIQRDPLPLPLPALVSGLLAGDVFFIGMVMVAGGGTGGPLPILLFPQLAASGWLLRTRTAFFHAASASPSRSAATPRRRRISPRSAGSTSRTSSRSIASSSRTCRTACSSST